jgi:8-oxo-dGTP diphosphatase
MKEYVAGFLFNERKKHVALILKNRPDWQSGKFNAIGGSVETEKAEFPLGAMRREFKEETGLDVDNWHAFATLEDDRGWKVYFYWAIGEVWACRKTTDEDIKVFRVEDLPENIIPNLRWLIPMALSIPDERCDGFVIRECKSAHKMESKGW